MLFEAYWADIDWKAIGSFAIGIGGVAYPFFREWRVQRRHGTQSQAQIAESTAQRLERIANENYERVTRERDKLETKLAHAEAAIENAQAQSRAMEEWAHWFRHGWCDVLQRYSNLATFFDRLSRDELTAEVAQVIAHQTLSHMPVRPRPTPSIREAAETGPPD